MSTVAALPDGADVAAAAGARADSWQRFLGYTAAVAGALIPIVYSPVTLSETFTPKYALLFVLTAIGVVPLWQLARSSRYAWPARFALAFIAVSIVSAALSPSKLVGFLGLDLWGEGAVFLASLASAWAIGASLGPLGRRWLLNGLLVGAAANAVAAVIQTTFQLNTQTADLSGFGLFDGTQADGMMGNPIHLEAILLGGLALVLGRTCRARGKALAGYGVLVALFSAGLECSSERYGVLVVVALAAYAVLAYRVRSLAYLVSIGVGFGATILAGGGASLGQRVKTSTATTTFGLRVHGALDAVLATLRHQPLLGFGPGEQRNALYLYEPVSLARTLGPGRYFTDVHDLPANILVMTGVVGFVLFAVFFTGAAWRVRGAFAGYAAASFAVALVEPMNVGVTPLAFLALGAALGATCGDPWAGRQPAPRRRALVVAGVLGAVALVPAALMLTSDVLDHSAQLHFSLADARTADALWPVWPQSAQEVTEMYNYRAIVEPAGARADFVSSLQWSEWSAARDPSDGELWVVVGEGQLELGDVTGARASAQRAVDDYPVGTAPLELLGLVDANLGDWPGSIAACRTAASIAPDDQQIVQSYRAALRHDLAFFHVNRIS